MTSALADSRRVGSPRAARVGALGVSLTASMWNGPIASEQTTTRRPGDDIIMSSPEDAAAMSSPGGAAGGPRRALITGVTGQDGSYLAELLLAKGYAVWGLVRRTSRDDEGSRVDHLKGRLKIVDGDITDLGSMASLLSVIRPHEVYNLAAQSFVPASWRAPIATAQITALGVTNLLEAIRHIDSAIRFYQASSSPRCLACGARDAHRTELTPRLRRAVRRMRVAKTFAHHGNAVKYREALRPALRSSGILFNHESPRRGLETFVTRKITRRSRGRIKFGLARAGLYTGQPRRAARLGIRWRLC